MISDLLLETLGSIDVSQSHEALIYCIGALKFLTGNATIAKQLVKKDCVERLATCLTCINKSVSYIIFLNSFTATGNYNRLLQTAEIQMRWLNEPSHLDLCCLTFSLSALHINVFPSDSSLK